MGGDKTVKFLGELPVTFEVGSMKDEEYVVDSPYGVVLPLDEESISFAGVLQSLHLSL